MPKPATHITASTMHGPPLLGPGCPTVLVTNKPAWRVGDTHTCPLVNLPPPAGVGGPHATGVTMPPGAITVFIGGKPAAGMGDIVMEATAIPPPLPPVNNIMMGAPTVMVG
jgi:uncharacterized Zn-binding protein involved in type VI secretion